MDGWPAIFVVTSRKVEKGEELLGYYGDGYGESMKALEDRKRKFDNLQIAMKSYAESVLGESAAVLLARSCEL